MRNPLCGDEIDLHVKFDGDRVTDLKFTGRGCSISQAAASMMTEAVKGKTAAEASALWDRYHAMILGDQGAASDKTLGPLRSLSGVSRFPARVRCALLAWNALEEALENRSI
jgi:nitrogen fixation NifU-like protein